MIFNTNIGGGKEPTIQALTVIENGTYTAPEGVDGYSPVTVDVPSWIGIVYTGSFSDERGKDGKGNVTFHTSGILTLVGGDATVSAYIQGGGGGAVSVSYGSYFLATGGGGGYQTITGITLKAGQEYPITIGTGGSASFAEGSTTRQAGSGGTTTAFGYTCTGGTGGQAASYSSGLVAGVGGTPNGGAGRTYNTSNSVTLAGGSPNGGGITNVRSPDAGGNGSVRLTFS